MFLFAPSHSVARLPLWSLADAGAAAAADGEYEDDHSPEELFQVTKAEFRRLTRQQEQFATRSAPPPPPQPPAATDATLMRWFRPEPHVDAAEKIAGYRAELEASARAFCDRKKWAPLLHRPEASAASPPRLQPGPVVDDGSATPRPLSSGRRPTPPVRPATAAPTRRRIERADAKRPLSAIANSRFADEVTYGAYDTLTPDVMRALSIRCDGGGSGSRERSRAAAAVPAADVCGDASPRLRPSPYALWTVDSLLTTTATTTDCTSKGPCNLGHGGNAGSSGPSSRRAASIEHSKACGRAELPQPPPMAIASQSGAGWRRAARVKEPEATAHAEESEEEEEQEVKGAHLAAAARDRSRYDFEAGATPQPHYPFKDALSPLLMAVDFASVVARSGAEEDDEKTAFDSVAIGDVTERKIAVRLLQLSRLQLATRREEDESRRRTPTAETTEFARWPSRLRPRLMAAAAAAAAASCTRRRAAPGARACCVDCLQPACVGDCPEKKPRSRPVEADNGRCCPLCRRRSCAAGSCPAAAADAAAPYEAHERRPDAAAAAAAEVDRRSAACASSGGVRRARPRSCGPRLTRQTAVTYSVAEAADAAKLPMPTASSSRPPTASSGRDGGRGALPGSPVALLTPTAVRCRSARLRGRDSVLPGKSFFSQRRRSLTGGGGGGCSSAARDAARSSNRERRARSAKS